MFTLIKGVALKKIRGYSLRAMKVTIFIAQLSG